MPLLDLNHVEQPQGHRTAQPTSNHPISSRPRRFCCGLERALPFPPYPHKRHFDALVVSANAPVPNRSSLCLTTSIVLFHHPTPTNVYCPRVGLCYVWGNLPAFATTKSATREPPASAKRGDLQLQLASSSDGCHTLPPGLCGEHQMMAFTLSRFNRTASPAVSKV